MQSTGDVRRPFAHAHNARQVLSGAEQELQMWQPNLEPVHLSGGLGINLMSNEEDRHGLAKRDHGGVWALHRADAGIVDREKKLNSRNKPALLNR